MTLVLVVCVMCLLGTGTFGSAPIRTSAGATAGLALLKHNHVLELLGAGTLKVLPGVHVGGSRDLLQPGPYLPVSLAWRPACNGEHSSC